MRSAFDTEDIHNGRSGGPPMRVYLLDVFLNTSGDATANPANLLYLYTSLGCQCSVVSVYTRGMPWVSVFSSVSVQ